MLKDARSYIYNAFIKFTSPSYKIVLKDLPPHSRLLDVGIGTGQALMASRSLILEKNLQITGIDIDRDYIAACDKAIKENGLEKNIKIKLASVIDYKDMPIYDAIYFSSSFMLLPNETKLPTLINLQKILKPNGLKRIYFYQAHEANRSPMLEFIKPRLKSLTTIDFGAVTYEEEFNKIIKRAGLRIVKKSIVSKNNKRELVVTAVEPDTSSQSHRP